MSVRQDIIDHLLDNGDDSFNSYLTGNFYGINRRCDLTFPASCWETARTAGYSFLDVLNKTKDKTFDCLFFMTIGLDDYDPEDHLIYINAVEFSSLWRPADPSPPHKDGRALDIVRITFALTGTTIIFQAPAGDKPEPAGVDKLRDALYPSHVTQYLSPWWMASQNPDGTVTNEPNHGVTALEKTHLTHLHLTIPRLASLVISRRPAVKGASAS